MNCTDKKYSPYALAREMLDTVDIVKSFDPSKTAAVAGTIKNIGKLMLAGEGSSRLFPAKNALRKAYTWGIGTTVASEYCRQAAQYDLSKWAVFCASNSGRTREVVVLAKKLRELGHRHCYCLTAGAGTVLAGECVDSFMLTCGEERAVAATKSVVEQALFYESIICALAGRKLSQDPAKLSEKIDRVLGMTIDPEIVRAACGASTIYFAGYNDGAAEELALKTNEITRRKSGFLEGTYAVHGIEEVMEKNDIVFVVDPIEEEMEKFRDVLVKGVGMTVVAIAARETPFPTILVPDAGDMTPCVYLAAGWNLLVEIGLALGVNLDKPERARKVGNEFVA